MRSGQIKLLSNFLGLDQVIGDDQTFVLEYVREEESVLGFVGKCLRADVVILNTDQKRLMIAGLLRWLMPFARFRLVSVDLILRPRKTFKDRLKIFCQRILFSRVDRFVLYFKNLRGYQEFYGIGPERLAHVPFKVNDWEKIQLRPRTGPGEDYVMCAGRTMRDVNTFVEAIRLSGCPGLLHQQKAEDMAKHGTVGWNGELPPNLKMVIDDSYQHEVFLDFIAQARLVVIPRFRNDIGPAGIATYLVAMALNKCVIISEGPGAEDVLTDQAAIVPAEDVARLAEEIKSLWNDETRRTAIASRGYQYAMSLGGEQRLLSDIVRVSIEGVASKRAEVLCDSRA